MQTFLPYSCFTESAKCMDKRRLWKQCVEVKQLLLGQFPNHPASKMWRGYKGKLALYGIIFCQECLVRGIRADNVLRDIEYHFNNTNEREQPFWLGNEEFHSSHRSNLLRKNNEWYGKFGWTESDDLPYFWPVK